jgi:DNA-binding CsgD family transcriptional regulator/tetratricopeptide (TPR) repeat protein
MHGFVGRESELAALRSRLAAARAGEPQIVEIQGPPGIGKTALLTHFLADPGPGVPPVVLRASGEETEVLLSYGVIDQLARSAGPAGDSLLLPPGSSGAAVDDAVTVGWRLLQLLGGPEGDVPVLLVVDDVHWVDQPSLKALVFALRRLVADPVLVLLAVRDTEAAELPEGLRRIVAGLRGSVLQLEGLDEEELRNLGAELGVGLLARGAAERLRSGTQGNPLYARAVLEEFPPDDWAPGDRPLPSPRSFRRLVLRRYEQCGADTRRLLDAAAVLGPRSPLPLVAGLGEVDDPVAAVDEAAGCELLAPSTEHLPWALSFPHPLIRSAVLDVLGPARRTALHAAAAGLVDDESVALRHRVAATPARDAGLSADLARFAEREALRQAWPSAAAHLMEAARLAPDRNEEQRLLLRAVSWLLQTGDAATAETSAGVIRSLPSSPLRDSVLGSMAMARGEPAAAESFLSSAWAQCGPDTDAEVVAAIALQYGVHRYGRLDAAGAVEWCLRAIERTEPGSTTRQTAQTYLAHSLAYSGRMTEALAATADADGDPGDTGFGWLQPRSARGMLRLVEGDLPGARTDLLAVATKARELGVLNTAAFAFASLSRADYLAGDWDDAVLHAGQAVAVNDESQLGFLQAMVTSIAALVPAARGEWAVAEAVLTGPGAPSPGDYERSVLALAVSRARLAESRGDVDGVLAALAPVPAFPVRDAVDEPGFWSWADLYAEALVATGRVGEADALLRPHEELAAQRGRQSAVARLARARGRVEAAARRPDGAEAAFADALTAADRAGYPFEQAKVQLAAGQFLRRSGQRRRAAELLVAARRTFTTLGAAPWENRCALELAGSGLHPASRQGRDSTALTSQELVVARLAAAGRTNREIAGELVVSVKTVEYHLRNAFQKLGIARRRELAARLAAFSTTL